MDHSAVMAGSQADTGVAVHAGFPNPAADRTDASLSLDRLIITHPVSTYFFRITGHASEDRGIFDGDIAVIDRALAPRQGDLTIWWDETGAYHLSDFKPADRRNVWGVVSAVVHQYRERPS